MAVRTMGRIGFSSGRGAAMAATLAPRCRPPRSPPPITGNSPVTGPLTGLVIGWTFGSCGSECWARFRSTTPPPGWAGGTAPCSRRSRCAQAMLSRASSWRTPCGASARRATWPKALQGCISRLRKALGPQAIQTDTGGYRLLVPPDEVDLRQFEHLVRRAASCSGSASPSGRRTPSDRGAGPVARRAARRPRGVGARRLRRPAAAGRAAPGGRGDCGSRRRCGPGGTARCSRRRRPWSGRADARAAVGAARPGAVPVRAAGRGAADLRRSRRVLAEELGLDPGPSWSRWSRRSCGRTTVARASPMQPRRRAGLPVPRASCPTTSTTRESFFGREDDVAACLERLGAAGARRGRPVGLGQVLAGPGRGRRGAATPGRERVHRGHARRASPWTRSPRRCMAAARPVLVVDQCRGGVHAVRRSRRAARQFLDELADDAEPAHRS